MSYGIGIILTCLTVFLVSLRGFAGPGRMRKRLVLNDNFYSHYPFRSEQDKRIEVCVCAGHWYCGMMTYLNGLFAVCVCVCVCVSGQKKPLHSCVV